MRWRKPIEEVIRTRLNFTVDPPLRSQLLARALREQEQSQETEPAINQPVIRRMIMKTSVVNLGIAAAIIAVVGLGILEFVGGTKSGVAWADITEHFESVPFFGVTIYLGHDGSDEAKKIEIWKAENSLIRAHEGNKVIFARAMEGTATAFAFWDTNKQIAAFDRSTKQAVEVSGMVRVFLGVLCPQGRFSLSTLLESSPGDVDISAIETGDTAASKETLLFDGTHKSTPERVRIWALRHSKLPVRMRFEDPRNGECADFLFNYSQKKDAAFFDPNAFTSGREN